ncbi:MAG: PEGA domain-containing protein [Kofleriaceae bacterium]
MSPWGLLGVFAVGCASRASSAPAVTAIVLGPDPIAHEVSSKLASTFTVATLPEPIATDTSAEAYGTALAQARKAYVAAEFPRCRTALAAIDPIALLDRQRATAARVLMWRVACSVGEGTPLAALRDAETFAAIALETPADISAVTPDVEALLAEAAVAIAKEPAAPLRVVVAPAGARVAIDGRADRCVAPCTVMLARGAHAIGVVADGFEPAWRQVLVPADREVIVELAEAAPPVIAAQLRLRIARGAAVDEPATLALVTRAVRARRLLVLGIEPGRLVGAVYEDGRVGARGERTATTATAAAELANELVARSQPVTPLWRHPKFWISVGAAAVLAAGITGYFLFRPDPESRVVFP